MIKHALFPIIALCMTLHASAGNFLSADSLRLVLTDSICPIPAYGSAYWQQLPLSVRQGFIHEGETLLGTTWESLPIVRFADFRTTGDRDAYQSIIYGKHNRLAYLTMAEIMEGKGRFMPDILNGLLSVCEETWWGVPAHYGPKMPLPERQDLDLFNAETGGQMAWTLFMLRSEIDKFSPLLTQRIEQEIQRRILTPGLTHNDWWRTSAMNWNPWICSNWLACVLLVEKDKEQQIAHLQKIFACLDIFIDQYPEDGGCDEGPSYWDRATGSLIDCLWLLGKATNGAIDLSQHPKLAAMGSYLCKMNIGNGYCVNFADASPRLTPNILSAFPTGQYLHDAALSSYAAQTAADMEYIAHPTKHKSYLFSVGRELTLLSMLQQLQACQTGTVLYRDAYLPRIQVVTARSKENSTEGLYFAAKGGHNGESHNHNDVGSFILYANAQPLLIDPGVGTYRRETFNNATRYDIFTMQSGYHNLPKINGCDQRFGQQYAARDVRYKQHAASVSFSLDIAGAYPPEAKVQKWQRSYLFKRGTSLTITEDYQLAEYTAPTDIMLLTPLQPTIQRGTVRLTTDNGSCIIAFDPAQMEATAEEVDMKDEKLTTIWGKLYRIRLRILDTKLHNRVTYSCTFIQSSGKP